MYWSSLRRLRHIAAVIILHGLAYLLGPLVVRWPRLARGLPVGLSKPERLRTLIEDLGGTFIKFGQMLALQPDILSLEYCNALFNLLDRVAPFSFEHVERIFIEELGRSPRQIFDRFEHEPIATASIGQVHVAYLAGRKLAVKVQRPSVETDFAGDMRLMAAAIHLVRRLHLKKLYWIIEPMSEFVTWTHEEMDYRREAGYMKQLRINALTSPSEQVPEVISSLTTRRTLVAEFFEGVTVLDYLRALEMGDEVMLRRLKAYGFDPDEFARNIIGNFLSDAYRHGMFHADLHPANLMILPGNSVGYIDFGITGVLSQYSRQNLIALTLAYTRADFDGMCDAFFKSSSLARGSDPEGFRDGLKTLSQEWYAGDGEERRLLKNFTLVMLDMLKLSRKTAIWPERDVIKYIRSAIAIDGLITRSAPGFNVGGHLETVCEHYLKWDARRALFSYDLFVDRSASGVRLMRDGALRAAKFIERVATGEFPARLEPGENNAHNLDGLRVKAMLLGAVTFAVSLLVTLNRGEMQFGMNLFTAEAMLIAAAAITLFQTIYRLS